MLPLLQVVTQVPRGGADTIPRDTLFQVHDTLAAVAGPVRDTLRPPPLPGGVAAAVRFIFGVPQWVQIAGIVVGAIVAVAVLYRLWQGRLVLVNWLRTRSRDIQLTLAGATAVVLLAAAFAGKTSWDYMQHDNGFCTGCHIMERPFGAFQTSAGKHESLKCHNCHQQSLYASMRQLVLWVADRPSEIGPHASVPNSRCESCHQVAGGHEIWQHVMQLAGHRMHFGTDSAVLRDLHCVKCHGVEIHHFIPANRTCQQSGCHEDKSVRLGKMATLPTFSCVTCHAFRADLPALASMDSVRRALIPSKDQCLTCHGMQGKPSGYVADKDPHKGSCGACHDVHKDTKPSDARARCITCHATVVDNPFHSGVNHRGVATQCLTCHQPHAASVDASNCVGCHESVRKRGLFHPPLPFDTNAAIRRSVTPPPPPTGSATDDPEQPLADHHGKGDAMPDLPPIRAAPAGHAAASTDTFPHDRHKSLPCLTCHTVNRTAGAYGLVFAVPRGCDLCHHQNAIAGKVTAPDCTRCHQIGAPRPTAVAIAVDSRAPNVRTVAFRHDRHDTLACTTCHQPPDVTPPDSVRSCTACHAEHHDPARNCTSCHSRAETPAAHSRTTHSGCDACHSASRIAPLLPNRNFCLICHAPQHDHQPGRECTTCHFLQTPEQYRPHLLGGSPS